MKSAIASNADCISTPPLGELKLSSKLETRFNPFFLFSGQKWPESILLPSLMDGGGGWIFDNEYLTNQIQNGKGYSNCVGALYQTYVYKKIEKSISFVCVFKGTVSRDFQLKVFSWISFSKPLSLQLGPFQIFSKIRGDIRSLRCTASVVDTGGKFAPVSTTSCSSTGGKICCRCTLLAIANISVNFWKYSKWP